MPWTYLRQRGATSMDSARFALLSKISWDWLRKKMLEYNTFRNIPLPSNTLTMLSNATSSAERKGRSAAGGLGSRN